MTYKVEFTEKARKKFNKLDSSTKKILLSWLSKNLHNCENPRLHGKALVGDLTGKWRYRIGDYRLICKIEEEKIIILVLDVGHRREIYN